MNTSSDDKKGTTIRDLYPHLCAEQLHEAENRLEQYLMLVLRIYERIQSEPESYAQFHQLTPVTGAVSSPAPGSCPVSHPSTKP